MSLYNKLFENWNKFLKEEEINEVTEGELEDISGILRDLKPQDLSFNNIFGDKMRIITSMQAKDENLEYLKKILKESGYIPDFSTGLATYYVVNFPGGTNAAGDPVKPNSVILDRHQTKRMTDKDWQSHHPEHADKVKKKQVKIGKLLQKGSRLFDIAKKSQNEFEKIKPTDFDLTPLEVQVIQKAAKSAELKLDDIVKADNYKKASEEAMKISDKDLGKLTDTFQGFKSRAVSDINPFQNLANWWNKKSTFYREHPEAAETGMTIGENSIIYTRHPIDVLRMSDFDNIESCHSPASRGGGASYYKCVVAEAHAHGFVAYVVKNEDLQSFKRDSVLPDDATDQDLLDFLEKHDEELFLDTERGTGDITPIARLRVKKYTNPSLEVALAVPEERVYGKRGAVNRDSFVDDVVKWAQEKQSKVIKKIVDSKNADNPYEAAIDETDYLELGKWERHGGTYQDTSDTAVLYNLLKPHIKGARGQVHIDSTTEDNLEINPNLIEQWQQEVNEISRRYNNRMEAITVEATVEDDGAGEAYVSVNAKFILAIDEDEFVSSAFQDATRNAIESLAQELIDYGYHWLNDYVNYTTMNPRSEAWADLQRRYGGTSESKVVIEIPVDMEQVNPEGIGFAYSPDDFENICMHLDEADNASGAVREIAIGSLKRQGVMKGSGLFELARALEDESWYEWSHEIDDDWNPTSIEIETRIYVPFNDLIEKIPITFDHQPDKSSEVFIMFAGDPLALASRRDDGEGNFIDFEVRSPEFDTERMDGFKSMDAIKKYAQWNVANMILRPKSRMLSTVMGGSRKGEATRDYSIAVKLLIRDEVGGVEGEFMYPNSSMWVDGPDGDDEYQMRFMMHLDGDDPDEITATALKIITETDDEDMLREIFRTAFTKVAKISGASVKETKEYFKKFDIF